MVVGGSAFAETSLFLREDFFHNVVDCVEDYPFKQSEADEE